MQQHNIILDDEVTLCSENVAGGKKKDLCQPSPEDKKPPQLIFKLKKAGDVPKSRGKWSDDHLPIDILLLTSVERCDFLSCFSLLDQPFKCYKKEIGFVYFGRMGDVSDQEKLKVALISCSKGAAAPGGSLTMVLNAVHVLQPKAVFSVGTCISLGLEKARMGDVVISSKLTTSERFKTPGSRLLVNLVRDAPYGWVAPLKNPDEWEIEVHCDGDILSQSLSEKCQNVNICEQYPGAVAIETEGEGVYAAAFDANVEWVIVKGVASYFHQSQSATSEWMSFASTMAASVVAKILNDPAVFREWPHYNQGVDHGALDQGASLMTSNRLASAMASQSRIKGEKGQVRQEAMSSAVNILQEPGNPEHPEPARAQNDLDSAVQTLKDNCLQYTEKLNDFKQPFGRPSQGEGHRHDLRIDKIYVHVVIVEGRAFHNFGEGRWEQLQHYPPDADDRLFKKPEDIIDKQHINVLVVGRPGIGKTSLSVKLLRLWASGEAFNRDEHDKADFSVVFLVKFRHFSDNAKLSLRDVLARAETVQGLDAAVWDFIKNESTKVLLIFDGLDEYSRKKDINAQDDPTYKNCVEEKMPVSVLYNKLVERKLLPGASIITTTRPTAVKYVDHLDFQRTVEIRGFTSDDVKEYVENFAEGVSGAKEKIWEHINSNINLFSFCYIPVNCFLICHCLLQIILSESSQTELPTKMTDIYKMTVKMFLFNHNREGFSLDELERLKSKYMYKPFEKFPQYFKQIINRLGKIAFKGIEEGRLLFESSDVSGLKDCGLLHKLPDLKPKALGDPPKSQFCFTHLTVQEFFAAKHLVHTESNEGIERFVCKHINDGTWQVVLQFVAGLLKSSSDIFIKLLPELTDKKVYLRSSKPEQLTFWPATKEDRDLAVQVCKCLYEINDEQQPILQNKIEKIKLNAVDFSQGFLSPIDVAAVLHFLDSAEEVLYINLGNNALGDLNANEVKKFLMNRERKLKWLDLSYNSLTDNAAKDLGEALKHKNCKLESLDLSYNNLTDNAAKDLGEALKHSNCKLKSLGLSGNKFTDNAAKDLVEALKHSNCKLKSLELFGNNFIDDAAKDVVEALKHSDCKLKSLELFGNNFMDNVTKDLGEALKHSTCKLEPLELFGNNFIDDAVKDLVEALKPSNCKLKSLPLFGNNLIDKAMKGFGEALKHSNCKLESLHPGSSLSDNAAKDLAEALTHSNCKLESLHLGSSSLSDNAAKDFGEALKHSNCKLKSLHLCSRNLTDNAAKDLGEALKHSNCKLESLYLVNSNLTDNAAKDLGEALKHSNCKLESLHLSSSNLTDNAAKDLGEALKHSNCKLESLHLGSSNLTDNAAKDLGEALKYSNCKLESLHLGSSNLTDNAAKDLGEALKHSNCKLESLYLVSSNLTDNAAKDLGEALKHSNCKLKSLVLFNEEFTKEGRQYLTDAGKQSNCKVIPCED